MPPEEGLHRASQLGKAIRRGVTINRWAATTARALCGPPLRNPRSSVCGCCRRCVWRAHAALVGGAWRPQGSVQHPLPTFRPPTRRSRVGRRPRY
eukprot:scaffold351_cov117-Isochrysis_galbana.AAC.1